MSRAGWRQAGRWLVLIAAVALAWPIGRESSSSVWLPALSPYVAIPAAVGIRAVSLLTLVALPLLLLALVYPRWFCRHGCPTGLLQEWVERLRPESRRRRWGWPAIGPWWVLLTLGGAFLGYPLFLWLDPLAIFHGFLNGWRQPIALATLLTGLALPLLLLLDLAAPQLWCQRICPLGATQDLLIHPRRWLRVRSRRLGTDRAAHATTPQGGRRWFLAGLSGAACGWLIQAVRRQSPPALRPPGSLEDSRFTGVCLRCGNCARVCPSKIIQPDFGRSGVAGFLAPRLEFTRDYCREDCHRCNRVCPSGAIARLSLAAKRRHVIGLARVAEDRCLLVQGRECNACVPACPYDAIAIDSSVDPFSPRPWVFLDRCNGCGACEAACPTRPSRAITVQPIQDRAMTADLATFPEPLRARWLDPTSGEMQAAEVLTKTRFDSLEKVDAST